MPSLVEHIEERGNLVEQQRALLDKAEAEGRELNAEEEQSFNRMDADIEAKDKVIEREDKVLQRQNQQGQFGSRSVNPPPAPGIDPADQNRDDQTGAAAEASGMDSDLVRKAMEQVVRRIMRDRPEQNRASVTPSRSIRLNENRSSSEYRDASYRFLGGGLDVLNPEERATLQIDSNIGGGYLRPPEQFINRLIMAIDSVVNIRQFCTVFAGLNYGDSMGAVSLDGDIGAFEWGSGELTSAVEDTGLALGKRELEPKNLKRKLVKVSQALLNNARMDIEGLIIQRVTQSLNETLETAYMTGSGSQRPLGLFTASNDGIPTTQDVTLSLATGPKADDLIDIQDTLADGHQPQARWLSHKDFITKVRKLKDGDGQYLWQPGLQTGVPNMILGKPYTTNDFAPNTFTASQYVCMFGDFTWYWIADAYSGMEIQRLVEKYALEGQIGLLFSRISADAMPVLSSAFVRGKTAAS